MKVRNRIIVVTLLMLCFLLPFVTPAGASTLTNFYGSGFYSGWTFMDGSHAHMGQKSETFMIKAVDRTALVNYANAADGGHCWGTNISFTEDATDGRCYIYRVYNPTALDTCAYITNYANDSDNHRSSWEIAINKPIWYESINALYSPDDPDMVQAVAARRAIMAHEVGHGFGLGHSYSDSTAIMYDEDDWNTRSMSAGDLNGMKVCTHVHSGHSSYTYAYESYTQHLKYCGICDGYFFENHSYGPYQNYNETYHRELCTKSGCGVHLLQNHTFPSSWSQYSSTQHSRVCTTSTCARRQTQNHSWEYQGTIAICRTCGYVKDLLK